MLKARINCVENNLLQLRINLRMEPYLKCEIMDMNLYYVI